MDPEIALGCTEEVTLTAVSSPPVVNTIALSCAATVLMVAVVKPLSLEAESRILTGLPSAFEADLSRARFTRGTRALMPESWGVVEDAQLTDSAQEWEKRDGHGALYGAGVEGTVYRLSLQIRMPAEKAMPAKGEQFLFKVRGVPLIFTVWAGVKEMWRIKGLRMVDVPARHYTDFPNAAPDESDDAAVPQVLASTAFTA